MRFAKGHGTGNDFVVIPDPAGELDLTPEAVIALCDRRTGVGADGVLRVVRTSSLRRDPHVLQISTSRSAEHADLGDPFLSSADLPDDAEWFMDYRNADGSVAEMCGNGVRVFAAYLLREGLATAGRIPIATRSGVKTVTTLGNDIFTVEMGKPVLPGFPPTTVTVGKRSWAGTSVDMGNPHVVVLVNSLAEAGSLYEPPKVTPSGAFPTGANVEFVQRTGETRIDMRVYERGVGETMSCGTGACAAAVAAALWDGASEEASFEVGVPGGLLGVTWSSSGIALTGPAVIVFEGEV